MSPFVTIVTAFIATLEIIVTVDTITDDDGSGRYQYQSTISLKSAALRSNRYPTAQIFLIFLTKSDDR